MSKEEKFAIAAATDGACSGNPGPGGWGALIRFQDGSEVEFGGFNPETTNNRMELTAAIEGLEQLKRPMVVVLTTDSQYVKDGITKWIEGWKAKGWITSQRKPVKNVDLWKRLDQVVAIHTVEWKWVKGHSGHRENEMVDQAANIAIDEMQSAL